METRIQQSIRNYNSFAEGHGANSRLKYEKGVLYLCTAEGLEQGTTYSKLQTGRPDAILKTVKALQMVMCFEHGD